MSFLLFLPRLDAPFPLDAAVPGVYGMPLETHLKASEREIALPIEACVMMLLSTGMREEVGAPLCPAIHLP